ncbi:MAG: type II toxin-antitoxin system VapB family antitoxin [Silvibacterium sp.]|nr:type II toxin-antitoxin system VapB family antitoxin [Silvibacterium sp.]
MARTNIDLDETLMRRVQKLTQLRSKRQVVNTALELLVRSESRKGILRYYGAGIWGRRLEGIAEKPRLILVDTWF